jgi:FtsP/CotA-like multicopper oxidase with cupredoxin domain
MFRNKKFCFSGLVRGAVLIGGLAILAPSVAVACVDCGGKGGDAFSLRERESKASQLYPDARIVEYALEVVEIRLSPAGKPVRALAINGSVPGPVLRFREGEVARIHVRNGLADEEVSLHWHGLLVPNLEDGVPYLTTPPIKAGEARTFEFLLKHAGTYWYHTHTGLQEQRGVYGSIVIEPREGAPARTELPKIDREEVLVLSDWTNESPTEVMRTLLRGSDWYGLRKGSAQSLLGAWRSGHLRDYLDREKARLPAMDVSDVAYDAFLINGKSTQSLAVGRGETVRLRVINAAAASYFYLSAATGPLTIIAADGMDVAPIRQNRLLIGMAETYDVLVTIPADQPDGVAWEVRATAQDNSGHASLLLGATDAEEVRPAPAPGVLNPYSMDDAMDVILGMMDADGKATDEEALAEEPARPLPPYHRLRAIEPTTLPADAPAREITLRLTGDMWRYLWSINGKTLGEADVIPVKRGEKLRVVLANDTMMHHPMHLHGHFFRLLMPNGAPTEFAPLKHTVDVPPMSRRVIEFYANEERDWLFHCHLLYHHKAGMGRVFSYSAESVEEAGRSGFPPTPDAEAKPHRANLGEHAMPHPYFWADAIVQSNLGEGLATVQAGRHNLNLGWDAGWERGERREYEIDATYSHYFNPRWTAFAGYRLTNNEGGKDGVIAGATYLLPYLVAFTATAQSSGDIRFALGRDLAITARLSFIAKASYDTEQDFEWRAGFAYTLTKRLSLVSLYDSEHGLGAGVGLRF